MSNLSGLKANALTTEEQPRLALTTIPHFWSSYETRWEKAKTHLVPLVLRGWDTSGAHALQDRLEGIRQRGGRAQHRPR